MDMPQRLKQVQPALAFAAGHLDEDLSLDVLADRAGMSAFHLHRVFAAAVGLMVNTTAGPLVVLSIPSSISTTGFL